MLIVFLTRLSGQEHEEGLQGLMKQCIERNGYLTVLSGHKSRVVQFYPESQKGLIFSWDCQYNSVQQLRLINVETGTLRKAFQIGNMSLLELSPDGKSIACISEDTRKMVIIDIEQGNIKHTGTEGVGSAKCLKWSPDSKYVACGSKNNILIWMADTSGEAISCLQGHRDWVNCIAWPPNSKLLASWGQESVLNIWDVAQKCILRHWSVSKVCSFGWSPDGQCLVTGGKDLQIWVVKTGMQRMCSLKGHKRLICSVSWSPDSRYIASGGQDAEVHIWDAATGNNTNFLQKRHSSIVLCVAWSADSKSVVSSGFDETIRIWKVCEQENRMPSFQENIKSLAASPCGKYVLSGSKDGTLRVWDVVTCKEARPSFKTGEIKFVAWSPIGDYIASTGKHGPLCIWDITTGQKALWPLTLWPVTKIEQMAW